MSPASPISQASPHGPLDLLAVHRPWPARLAVHGRYLPRIWRKCLNKLHILLATLTGRAEAANTSCCLMGGGALGVHPREIASNTPLGLPVWRLPPLCCLRVCFGGAGGKPVKGGRGGREGSRGREASVGNWWAPPWEVPGRAKNAAWKALGRENAARLATGWKP